VCFLWLASSHTKFALETHQDRRGIWLTRVPWQMAGKLVCVCKQACVHRCMDYQLISDHLQLRLFTDTTVDRQICTIQVNVAEVTLIVLIHSFAAIMIFLKIFFIKSVSAILFIYPDV